MLDTELFAFLENTTDAVFAVREQGEICFWNHSAETLFGYPTEEVLGKTCSTVLHGISALGAEFCHERCGVLECVRQTIPIPNFDLSVTTRKGERMWINVSSIWHLNRRTGETLLVRLARDISAQKTHEELLHRMIAISREVSRLDDAITGTAPPVAPLSPQELEILRMFARGTSSSAVAKALGISPSTLRNHLHHINRKLRTHNRLEAVMHALQRHLI